MIKIEDLPIGAVLALNKLVTDNNPTYKEARDTVADNTTYSGSITVQVDYSVHISPAGKRPAKPLDAWAIVAALFELDPGAVELAAAEAHHYTARETQADARKLAKSASAHTWQETRDASRRAATRVSISEVSAVDTLVVGGVK